MQALPLNLDIQCEVCDSNEYSEHESGFYVCVVCGTMTQIRFGMGLDYTDIHKSSIIIKRQINKEADLDTKYNESLASTTMINTCSNSEFGDSVSTRLSRGRNNINPQKTVNVTLVEHQKIYVKLFKTICYHQFIKTMKNFKNNEEFTFDAFLIFFDSSKYYQNIFNIAKSKWKDLVLKEFSTQKNKIKNINARSRRGTEDKGDKLNFTGTIHHVDFTHSRKKRNSIRDQLKSRKVKNYNIEDIPDFKDKKLNKPQKMKLFLEEYDQVKIHLKSYEDKIKHELGINNINESFSYVNILFIAQKVFDIVVEKNSSYEEIIHLIFVQSGLNLKSVFKEGAFYDQSKTNLTSDNFLSIFYSIFNENKGEVSSNPKNSCSLLFCELISFFKLFRLEQNLSIDELKFLKFINKESLSKLLDSSKIDILDNNARIIETLNFISENVMTLPNYITQLCSKIFKISLSFIQKNLNHSYNLENYCLGIIIYALKIMYGLNEKLPYFLFVYQNQESFSSFTEVIQQFINKSAKDKLFYFYKQLPSYIQIIKTLQSKISQDEDSKLLWENEDFKKYLNLDYRVKFLKNNEIFFKDAENNFAINNINSLEKKINFIFSKFAKPKKINMEVIYSKNLKKKLEEKKKLNTNTERKLHTFLTEEIEFYSKLNNSKNIEVPLPCDTYLRYNKKALKFEKISPSLSELIFFYFLSKMFKVEYKVLQKCLKNVERVLETRKTEICC